jgi:hypothetical protein
MSEIYNVTPMRPNGADNRADTGTGENVASDAANESAEDTVGAVAPSARALAETMIAQYREAYERGRESIDEAVSMVEVTIERGGEGAIALNRKVIDIAQDNLNSSLDLAKQLAGADSLNTAMELNVAFMRKQFETFTAQAQEVRELTTQVANSTSAPAKAHVSHSIQALNKTNH